MRPIRPITLALVAVALGAPAAAQGSWSATGTGAQTAKAITMPAGSTPTASVTNRDVAVSWSASSLPGGGSVSGYTVKRYNTLGSVQTIGSACSGTVAALSCTEAAVPSGSWRYSVTPVLGNWTGAESSQSTAVTVASPSLSFSSSTTVTTLPTTLSGTVASFVGGQTVTFRLDDPSTGTVLSGTLSPTPIPSGGGASVTVTIPSGTANGSHTVYVVGSQGDVASAGITVSVSSTITTSAWDLRDASSATEHDASAQSAFADLRTFSTSNWPTVFNTADYIDLDQNGPLPSGSSVSGATFNIKLAAGAAGDSACYWFEVRRASTNTVLPGGTHGSSGSPVNCVTGTTLQAFSTAIPEVNTSDLADDTRVRVYGRESGGRPFTIDVATVTGSTPSTSFTLYTSSYTDAANGTASTFTWSLMASGGASYTTDTNWSGTFGSTRYVKETFPAYVPSGATVTSATLKQAFRATRNGNTACYYFEVYSGATKIGTHWSDVAPLCNSSSSYLTDTVSLPEVNTAARANNVVVRMYFTVSGSSTKTTDHDFAQLVVNYQ